ncbi:hypothetical protein F4677DRAFT_438353 [Hypoxylon crocopeplum]|nr:hypothetical protein F4677DRAFT_438353 [Hypoxylon crocopeplum]
MLQDRNILNSAKPKEDALLFASKSERPYDLVVVYNRGRATEGRRIRQMRISTAVKISWGD